MNSVLHETPSTLALSDAIRKWRVVLGDISQNEFANRAGVDGSVLSRVLAQKAVAGPTVKKVLRYIARLERRAGAT